MLDELRLQNVGPALEFEVKFAPRLNIFTGDNGLGKTFLLDIAWWSLTGKLLRMCPDRGLGQEVSALHGLF